MLSAIGKIYNSLSALPPDTATSDGSSQIAQQTSCCISYPWLEHLRLLNTLASAFEGTDPAKAVSNNAGCTIIIIGPWHAHAQIIRRQA